MYVKLQKNILDIDYGCHIAISNSVSSHAECINFLNFLKIFLPVPNWYKSALSTLGPEIEVHNFHRSEDGQQ